MKGGREEGRKVERRGPMEYTNEEGIRGEERRGEKRARMRRKMRERERVIIRVRV